MSSLDFSLFILSRIAGQDQPSLPGLFVSTPPHRCARGRKDDHLILYVELFDDNPLPEEKKSKLFQDLAQAYYTSSGSVSSALRMVAEKTNNFLLTQFPVDVSGKTRPYGSMAQIVIRQDICYLAQSGPVHGYVIQSSGYQHLYDSTWEGRGLGQGKSFPLRFSQLELKPGEAFLLSVAPSASWNEQFIERLHGQGPETMRRRLSDRTASTLNAILIYAHRGNGRVQYVVSTRSSQVEKASISTSIPGSTPDIASAPPVSPLTPQNASVETDLSSLPTSEPLIPESLPPPTSTPFAPDSVPPISLPVAEQPPIPPLSVPVETGSAPSIPLTQQSPAEQAPAQQGIATPPVIAEPVPGKPVRKWKTTFLAMLVTIGDVVSITFKKAALALGRFFVRLVPEGVLKIPNSVMAVIAIAIPIVVVTSAGIVYYRLGQGEMGRQLYEQANQTASQAMQQTDVMVKRDGLNSALGILASADSYGGVSATDRANLRSSIQSELDRLDEIRRIDYRSAIVGGLDSKAAITNMVLVFDDLYMLDSNSGSILRAQKTPQGYRLDLEFQCSPSEAVQSIGKLIDMVAWPPGYQPAAAVVGADSTGKLVFCQPGEPPEVIPLTPSDVSGLREVSAITMDRGHLYALDIPSNSVWFYAGGNYDRQPNFLFGEQVPPMNQVIDLAVNFDEIYLLNSDGSLTLCFTNVISQSVPRCIENQPLVDSRLSRENQPFIPPHQFSKITANAAPDPSLYLLIGEDQSINRFTFGGLGFVREYQPSEPLPGGSATAFVVDDLEKIAFIAAGNLVYYGVLP